MRKPLMIVMLSLLLVGLLAPAAAASPDSQSGKPVLAVLPAINSSGLKGSHYLKDIVNESLDESFANSDRYTVLAGTSLEEGLRREGIDIRTADPAGLQAALRNMRVDYCLRTEVQYVVTEQQIKLPSVLLLIKTWYAIVPLRFTVIDVNQGVVYSDAVLSDHGQHDSIIGFAKQKKAVTDALYKVLDRFDREVLLP